MGVRLFPAVHGHIADSVRDHEPGLAGGMLVGNGAGFRYRLARCPDGAAEDVMIRPRKPAMDLRWTFHIPPADMGAGADYLAADSFELAVAMASAHCRGCGPAWLS